MKADAPPLPPPWAKRVLHRYCPAPLLEAIEGDLVERFQQLARTRGVPRARWT